MFKHLLTVLGVACSSGTTPMYTEPVSAALGQSLATAGFDSNPSGDSEALSKEIVSGCLKHA